LLRFSARGASAAAAASKELAASFRLDHQSYIAASWTGKEVQNPHKSHFSTLQCA
jgi:hypothetical protein